jgi:hypothetical protein
MSVACVVAGAQQDRDRRPAPDKVDAIARTVIDPHFHHAHADASDVTWVSLFHSTNAADDPCRRVVIFQTTQPAEELTRLAHFDHDTM